MSDETTLQFRHGNPCVVRLPAHTKIAGEKRSKLIALRHTGYSWREIGEKLGVSHAAAQAYYVRWCNTQEKLREAQKREQKQVEAPKERARKGSAKRAQPAAGAAKRRLRAGALDARDRGLKAGA